MTGWLQRQCAFWLRRKGWTVFWIDSNISCGSVCWLRAFREHEQREKR